MATCRTIVSLALRKLGVLGSGREPRDADRNDAFDALKDLYRNMIATGAFGRLRDVVPLSNYVANENERVFRNASGTVTITLPELVSSLPSNPRPYDRESDIYPVQGQNITNRNMRPPRDCSVVVICDAFIGTTTEFLYDGHQKLWQSLYDLTIDGNAPLSYRDAQGLAALLATSIADQFTNAPPSPTTIQAARIFQSSIVNGWSSPAFVIPTPFM